MAPNQYAPLCGGCGTRHFGHCDEPQAAEAPQQRRSKRDRINRLRTRLSASGDTGAALQGILDLLADEL